jgi:hypothetical protein
VVNAPAPIAAIDLALPTDTRIRGVEWFAMCLAGAIFAGLSVAAAVTSSGFLEADGCTHYQYARFALGEPHYLVNVWGRPFVTALYMIPATLGHLLGVRLTSLAVALAIAAIACRLAKDQKYRWPALAFIFTLAQPLVFLHSFSELTELPFALLLALAFWAYRRKQWLVMAILIALTPTARPEGFGFLLLGAVALVAHRRWWWVLLLPLPLLVWDYAGWRLYGRPIYTDALTAHLPAALKWLNWLRHEWPYAEHSAYRSGYLLHFIVLLPAVVSPFLLPATLLGIWRSTRGALIKAFRSDHLARCQVLIAGIPLLILIAHSLLYWLGRMASNGELRYMLIVAPFWGLLSAKGWEWAFAHFNWAGILRFAGVAALAPVLANSYYTVIPLVQTQDWKQARQIAEWYEHDPVSRDYPLLLAAHPGIAYALDCSPTDRGKLREWRKDVVDRAPPGTLLIWDPVYGVFNSDQIRVVTLAEIRAAGWIEDPAASDRFNQVEIPSGHHWLDGATPAPTDWHIFRSPRTISGRPVH